MSHHFQTKKLTRILSFYQTKADVIAVAIRDSNAHLIELQNIANTLSQQIEQTQTTGAQHTTSTANLLLTQQQLHQLASQQKDNCIRMKTAQAKLDGQRRELTELKSKIESLAKLIEKKSESLEDEKRKRDQHLADEQYLNTHFSGRTQ